MVLDAQPFVGADILRRALPAEGRRSTQTLAVMRCATAFLILSLGSLVASAGPASAAPKITGVYSDLRIIPVERDVVGTEMFLLYDGDAYWVLLQCAEGKLGPPELLPAIVHYPKLTFTVPKQTATMCPSGQFEGTLSPRGLKGSIKGLEWPGFLPRKKSYWQ